MASPQTSHTSTQAGPRQPISPNTLPRVSPARRLEAAREAGQMLNSGGNVFTGLSGDDGKNVSCGENTHVDFGSIARKPTT